MNILYLHLSAGWHGKCLHNNTACKFPYRRDLMISAIRCWGKIYIYRYQYWLSAKWVVKCQHIWHWQKIQYHASQYLLNPGHIWSCGRDSWCRSRRLGFISKCGDSFMSTGKYSLLHYTLLHTNPVHTKHKANLTSISDLYCNWYLNITYSTVNIRIQSPAASKHRPPADRPAIVYNTPAGNNDVKQSEALM